MSKWLTQADQFFNACETGQADTALTYVADGAEFSSDALPMTSLKDYVLWMKSIATQTLAPASYELVSKTYNENHVTFFAIFRGVNNGPGGPPPTPTGKSCTSPYVYVTVWNDQGKVTKMYKIWNVGEAFKQLGW